MQKAKASLPGSIRRPNSLLITIDRLDYQSQLAVLVLLLSAFKLLKQAL
jgi:hypothetical protein